MTDIALLFTDQNGGDISLTGHDFTSDEGLSTALHISLGTDRLAEPEDNIPDGSTERRGWPGDAFADIEGDRIGSRSWLLESAKNVQDVINKKQQYDEEALAWLVEDNIAKEVIVTVTAVQFGKGNSYWLNTEIRVIRPDKEPYIHNYKTFWEAV